MCVYVPCVSTNSSHLSIHHPSPREVSPKRHAAFFGDAVAHHETGALRRVVLHQHRDVQLTRLAKRGEMVMGGDSLWKMFEKELRDDGKFQ